MSLQMNSGYQQNLLETAWQTTASERSSILCLSSGLQYQVHKKCSQNKNYSYYMMLIIDWKLKWKYQILAERSTSHGLLQFGSTQTIHLQWTNCKFLMQCWLVSLSRFCRACQHFTHSWTLLNFLKYSKKLLKALMNARKYKHFLPGDYYDY